MRTVLVVETYRGFGEQAWSSIRLNQTPSAGQTITVNGDVFTFGTNFGGAVGDLGRVVESLAGQINGDPSKARFPLSAPHRLYYAIPDGNTCYFVASQPGTGGNAYTLATNMNAAQATLSGATFSGGTN